MGSGQVDPEKNKTAADCTFKDKHTGIELR